MIAIIPSSIIPPPIPRTAEIDDVINAEIARIIRCDNSKYIFYLTFLQIKYATKTPKN